MPGQPVTVRRWQVVGAFLLLFAVAVGTSLWNDHRIANAEARIDRNSHAALVAASLAERAARQNAIQNRIRHALVTTLHETDRRNCQSIEKLKAELRGIVLRSNASLDQLHGQLSDSLIARAKAENALTLHDLRAVSCTVVTKLRG